MWLRGAAPSSAKGSTIQALGAPNLKIHTNTHNQLPDIYLHTKATAHGAPRHWLSNSTPPDPKKIQNFPKYHPQPTTWPIKVGLQQSRGLHSGLLTPSLKDDAQQIFSSKIETSFANTRIVINTACHRESVCKMAYSAFQSRRVSWEN